MKPRKGSKPTPGHKCLGVRIGVSVTCECGWRSTVFYGDRARKDAYSEWRWHIGQHEKKETP